MYLLLLIPIKFLAIYIINGFLLIITDVFFDNLGEQIRVIRIILICSHQIKKKDLTYTIVFFTISTLSPLFFYKFNIIFNQCSLLCYDIVLNIIHYNYKVYTCTSFAFTPKYIFGHVYMKFSFQN